MRAEQMTDHRAARTDRSAGVLLAQACGDALGVPYEFGTPPGPGELAEMKGGGLGPFAPGEWSDDTQMAVCIARVAVEGKDLTDDGALDEIAEAFLEWAATGATDIGTQTRAVLRAARTDTGPADRRLAKAARAYASEHSRSAGNGALMRTAVVGLTRLDDRDLTAASARAVAELTHGDPLAGDSCVLWSEAVRAAVQEARFELADGIDLLPAVRRDDWAKRISDAATGDPRRFSPNGFTVTALQAAWAAITSTPVPELDAQQGSYPCLHLQHALHNAIRIGYDTDTVAAIAGGLLGARWGVSAVPARWRRAVHGWPAMRTRDLVALSVLTSRGGRPDSTGWPSGERMEYGQQITPLVPYPYDDELLLGTVAPGDHHADAVVSLCRMGSAEPISARVAPGDLVDVWLIDSDKPGANPNLDFVLADTAEVLKQLRDEGRQVLLHCVAAEQRTPSVAVAYAVAQGVPALQAQAAVRAALHSARARGLLWDSATGVPVTHKPTQL